MNPISCMSANYVGRQVGYQMTDWMHGQNAAMAFFQPEETYPERFAALLDEIAALGFDHLDLWLPHLHPEWATAGQIAAARELLEQRGLRVVSLAGGFGSTPAEFERCCRLAQEIGTSVLGGMTSLVRDDRAALLDLLERYDTNLAIENHPEKTPAEVLAQIGTDSGGRIGTCVDTGIWANQGYDPLRAIQELRPHILHVHLKDVLPAQHESCRFGRGVVPLEACVRDLVAGGYRGAFSIEHEPKNYDPSEDARASAEMARAWLA
jgi:L-ribulose-5-phosphate 3-epimerase